jgi:Fungal specific transcription factor domain
VREKNLSNNLTSPRQVQDLQNQLADAKHQIAQLRSMLRNAPGHPDQHVPDSPMLGLPALGGRIEQGYGPPVINNFEHVRTAMKTYSRGVFKLPPPYRDSMPTPKISTTELTLPHRHITNALLAQYHSHMHRHFPMIHWPTFNQQVDQAYAAGTLQGSTQIWVAIFFGILACATCQTIDITREGCNPDVDGMKYLIIAARLLNTWTDNLTIDHSRAMFFISTYLIEQNVRSAGWIYLGSAVRSAQDIGLSNENGPWSPLELEARRRVAWSIFSLDR